MYSFIKSVGLNAIFGLAAGLTVANGIDLVFGNGNQLTKISETELCLGLIGYAGGALRGAYMKVMHVKPT